MRFDNMDQAFNTPMGSPVFDPSAIDLPEGVTREMFDSLLTRNKKKGESHYVHGDAIYRVRFAEEQAHFERFDSTSQLWRHVGVVTSPDSVHVGPQVTLSDGSVGPLFKRTCEPDVYHFPAGTILSNRGAISNTPLCYKFLDGEYPRWRDVQTSVSDNIVATFNEDTQMYEVDSVSSDLPQSFLYFARKFCIGDPVPAMEMFYSVWEGTEMIDKFCIRDRHVLDADLVCGREIGEYVTAQVPPLAGVRGKDYSIKFESRAPFALKGFGSEPYNSLYYGLTEKAKIATQKWVREQGVDSNLLHQTRTLVSMNQDCIKQLNEKVNNND